jgi:hypothetical protein
MAQALLDHWMLVESVGSLDACTKCWITEN